jgi:hypothetical protein
MKTLIIISFCMLSLASCSLKAPYDYYYKLALIERTAESIRSDTGRKVGEKFEPPLNEQAQQDLAIKFNGEDEAEMTQVQTQDTFPKEQTQGQDKTTWLKLKEQMLPITGVNLKEGQLSSLLKQLGVNVVKVETIDGRLVGGKNSVRVSFVSKNEANEEKLLVEFSTICGAVYGFDKGQTVDAVTAFAEKRETLLPYIIIQTDFSDFVALSEGKISQKEWISKLTLKKL